jgi:hypothetical protein
LGATRNVSISKQAAEEAAGEQHFIDSNYRAEDGRYTVMNQ